MAISLGNVFGSPRTTLAGALGVVGAVAGQYLVPALAAYFGAQPSIGWQALGLVLGLVLPALLPDSVKPKLSAVSKPQ